MTAEHRAEPNNPLFVLILKGTKQVHKSDRVVMYNNYEHVFVNAVSEDEARGIALRLEEKIFPRTTWNESWHMVIRIDNAAPTPIAWDNLKPAQPPA